MVTIGATNILAYYCRHTTVFKITFQDLNVALYAEITVVPVYLHEPFTKMFIKNETDIEIIYPFFS